jgi:predicted  nucleic acid-binding Zn-ribbon protein
MCHKEDELNSLKDEVYALKDDLATLRKELENFMVSEARKDLDSR